MHITMIMATIGRAKEVERFLECLLRQTYKDFSLIIVDQNDDESIIRNIVEPFYRSIDLRILRSAPGLSRARNVGLTAAGGDIICFPDDDCLYPPSLLDDVVALFGANPFWDGVCGVEEHDILHLQSSAASVMDVARINLFNVWERAISFTIFLRQDVVRRVGGFDEELGVGAGTKWGAGEESDFLIRALKKGAHIVAASGVKVWHPHKGNSDISRDRLYSQGVGRVLSKHGCGLSAAYSVLRSIVGVAVAASGRGKTPLNRAWVKLKGKLLGLFSGPKRGTVADLSAGAPYSVSEISSRRPDVSFFIGDLNGGGAERIMLTLSRSFARQGLQVDFVVTKYWGLLKNEVPENVRYVSLDSPKVLLSLLSYVRYLKAARPRCVISTLENVNIIACLGKILSGGKHKLIVRVENSLTRPVSVWRQRDRFFWLTLVSLAFRFADTFVAISTGVAGQIRRVPGCQNIPIATILNPVLTPVFWASLDGKSRIDEITPFGDAKLIVSVGRLHKQKDYPTLFRALEIVSRTINVRLIIFGEGEEESGLVSLADQLGISGLVHFMGYDKNPYATMKHCDLFCLSSAWEGFGSVLVEALAVGLRVVSTDCPHGPREVLANGQWGALVPVGDHNALAKAISEKLSQPKSRAAEMEEYLAQFDSEFVSQKYMDLIS